VIGLASWSPAARAWAADILALVALLTIAAALWVAGAVA
jgi:hypothetical protein